MTFLLCSPQPHCWGMFPLVQGLAASLRGAEALSKQAHSRLRFLSVKLMKLRKEAYWTYKEHNNASRTYAFATANYGVSQVISRADQPLHFWTHIPLYKFMEATSLQSNLTGQWAIWPLSRSYPASTVICEWLWNLSPQRTPFLPYLPFISFISGILGSGEDHNDN